MTVIFYRTANCVASTARKPDRQGGLLGGHARRKEERTARPQLRGDIRKTHLRTYGLERYRAHVLEIIEKGEYVMHVQKAEGEVTRP